ncbi:DUF6000 family protein [Thermoactinospora rubra]|uniref:DUF6000 family protein n=1 Tax=Thermoactinospora rubra TaxID=1088767 RepID=UPI000A104D25|nr:DUF6000 family protein [Thermoactinospora rubra]
MLKKAVRRYVLAGRGPVRRYLELLHANFMIKPDGKRAKFIQSLAKDARRITDTELDALLDSEWRAGLTGAWLIGFDRRAQFRVRLGDLLLHGNPTYATQGYCFALARLGQPADAALLLSYLTVRDDDPWGIGALLHLDAQLGTHHAAQVGTPSEDGLAVLARIGRICHEADKAT